MYGRYQRGSLILSKRTDEVTKRAFLILLGWIECLQVKKKMTCSLLSYIKQCNTIFFMLPTRELELRCLMNWKDFKCSWIIKPSERWRGEQSGRCARLTDQEDLPVLSARRNKTSQNPPEVQARDVHTDFVQHRLLYQGKAHYQRHDKQLIQRKASCGRKMPHDAFSKNHRWCLTVNEHPDCLVTELFVSERDSSQIQSP